MRARRQWERMRSPHARLLEGLEAAVAAHPAGSARRAPEPRLTIVREADAEVIPLPTGRRRRSRPTPSGAA
jgi:hypothetical protein